jgi:hypothetical protein
MYRIVLNIVWGDAVTHTAQRFSIFQIFLSDGFQLMLLFYLKWVSLLVIDFQLYTTWEDIYIRVINNLSNAQIA